MRGRDVSAVALVSGPTVREEVEVAYRKKCLRGRLDGRPYLSQHGLPGCDRERGVEVEIEDLPGAIGPVEKDILEAPRDDFTGHNVIKVLEKSRMSKDANAACDTRSHERSPGSKPEKNLN